MIKLILLMIIFSSCEKSEGNLKEEKSVYLPPSFFEDKIDLCSSKDFDVLIKKKCKTFQIKESFKKNKEEFFESPLSEELYLPLIKFYSLELFYFLDQSRLLEKLDDKQIFLIALKEQKDDILQFLLEKNDSLYTLLFKELDYSKMRFIDESFKKGTLSPIKTIQTKDGLEFPLLWLAKTPYKNFNYSDQTIFKELIRFVTKQVDDNFQWEFSDEKGNNLLHLCANSDNDILGFEILEKNPHLLRKFNEKGRTPLHVSLYKNSELFYETIKDRVRAEDLLVEDYFSESPIELMVKLSRLKFFGLIFNDNEKEVIKDFKDIRERNLLHLATIYGQVRMAFELVRIGVDPKKKDKLGRDANYFAIEGAKQHPYMAKKFEKLLRLFKMVEDRGYDTLSDDDADALLKG
ncbi:MAG: hypothetical protein OEY33_03090 [Bdellovibrionales bacterium]|nr:hypothetical protein [Bdellovibrionales bacterium]